MAAVLVLGGLREKLGGPRLDVEAANVEELLRRLSERAGAGVARLLWADPAAERPGPSRDLRVLVNGRSIEFLDGLDTRLSASDAVTLHLAGARGWPGG